MSGPAVGTRRTTSSWCWRVRLRGRVNGDVRGRIVGGVAILWNTKYDSVVKVLHLNVDWAIWLEFNSNRNNCWWAAVVQEVKKSFSNHEVASSIPCRSVLEQDIEPLIAPDV